MILYLRQGCHLCADAREVLAQVTARAGTGWTEVDVDDDATLAQRYGELVPVVTVDGVQQGFWRLDPDRLLRALGS